MPPSRITLREVAARAGVSTMTASRALRGLPKVAASTREKVVAAAEALDYRVDPHLARLMSRVRSRKQRPVRATIAVLREETRDESLPGQPYRFVPIDFIRERALTHGFEAEEFWLGRDGLTAEKARKIFRARGIEAVIVSPQSEELPCSRFDYTGFATATFGFALKQPLLHTAATNVHLGIQAAAEELRARGYRRIGIALTEWLDSRVQNGYRSGLFVYQQTIPEKDRIPHLWLPEKSVARGFGRFRSWFETHQPDVVVSFDDYVPDWLENRLGLRIPDDVGFVVHDDTGDQPGFAGIDHRRAELAKAAVDLVIAQLAQFETGVPPVPRQVLVPPRWVEGPSVRRSGTRIV